MPRQVKVDPDRLTTLEQRFAKAQRDLRYARNEAAKQARAQDARRKIIAGALALEHTEKNPESEFGRVMARLLKEYVRETERHLFPDVFQPQESEPLNAQTAAPPSPAPAEVAA